MESTTPNSKTEDPLALFDGDEDQHDDSSETSSAGEEDGESEESQDSTEESDDGVPIDVPDLSKELALKKEAFKNTKLKDRPLCIMCSVATSKYQCPACSAVTCCLQCCKDHKFMYKCKGTASKAVEFVPLKEFSDRQITNDYHFLLGVEHTNTKAKRIFSKDFGGVYVDRTKTKRRKKSDQTPAPSFRGSDALLHYSETSRCLVRGAEERGVKLLLLPLGMSKRKENTSFMNNHSSTMFWRVLWVWKEALAQVIMDTI